MTDITWTEKDLGPVDAYALAVAGGYTGTKEQWIEEIANASTNASNTEAYAKGTRGGQAVTSDDPAYHNNAEYFKDLAQAAKTEAQTAAASASAAYGTALLAPNYSTESTYNVGDHVIYNGNYYVCNTTISTAESWTAAHWTQKVIGNELAEQKSAIYNITNGNYTVKLVPNESYKSYANGGINPASNAIGSTIVFGTQTYLKHAYIEVSDNEIYLVSLRAYANLFWHAVFTDASDKIISYDIIGNGVTTIITDYMLFVPSGAKRLYTVTNSNSGYPNSDSYWRIKKLVKDTDQISKDVVSVENMDDVYVCNIEGDIEWENNKWLFTSTGGIEDYNYTKISNNYIDVHEYSSIKYKAMVGNNQTNFGLIVYDESKNIVGRVYSTSSTANGTEDKIVDLTVFSGAYYVRLNYWNNTDLTYPSFYMEAYKKYALINKINAQAQDIDKIQREYTCFAEDTQPEDFVLGKISSTGIESHKNASNQNDRICTARYYNVYKGDIIVCHDMSMAVSLYNTSKEYQSTVSWIRHKYTSPGDDIYGKYLCENDGYVRLTFGDRGKEMTESDFGKLATICHMLYGENRRDVIKNGLSGTIASRKPKIFSGVDVYQDGTFIGNNLWMFADGTSSTGNIYLLNIETGEVEATKTHNLGHANGVDYNKNNDYLVTFYTNNHNPNILLYKNPSSVESLLRTDENCMIIPLYDNSTHLSPTSSLCWGEEDNILYIMDGVYSSYDGDTGVYADSIQIHKLLLGMGDNDLSSEGYGTFISGKANNEYNGTVKVLKSYSGWIRDGIDTLIYRNTRQTIQGMEYDGFLFVGWGTNGHNFLAIQLDDDTGTYWVHHNYMYHKHNYDYSSEITFEPELVALHGSKIYCGSTSEYDGSLLLSFER